MFKRDLSSMPIEEKWLMLIDKMDLIPAAAAVGRTLPDFEQMSRNLPYQDALVKSYKEAYDNGIEQVIDKLMVEQGLDWDDKAEAEFWNEFEADWYIKYFGGQ